MPWCDDCAKFWNPPSLRDGHCPTCGAALAAGSRGSAGAPSPDVERTKAPWHFKLLLVALVLYLSYRAVQGVVWVVHHV